MKQRIDTGKATPIRQPVKQNKMKGTSMMQKQGIIEKCKSSWTSSVVFAKKKDSRTQFCLDYRGLNKVTKKDNYPLRRIDDIMESLTNAHRIYIWTLHCAHEVHNIKGFHARCQLETSLAYLDDVSITRRSFEKLMNILQEALAKL